MQQSLRWQLIEQERRIISAALREHPRLADAAEALGVSTSLVRDRVRRYGIAWPPAAPSSIR